MLESSDDSIIFIAQNCGFNDSAYFCTMFKKLTGLTPRGYRMACVNNELNTAERADIIPLPPNTGKPVHIAL